LVRDDLFYECSERRGVIHFFNHKSHTFVFVFLDAEPECCVLEQFPPEGYHLANGR
jgi:hypothetical protein